MNRALPRWLFAHRADLLAAPTQVRLPGQILRPGRQLDRWRP